MRFRLGTLLGLVTAVALFLGVVFSAPVWLAAILLGTTMLLSPAVWVCGSSYASPPRQAFFRGGLICGVFPFAVASVLFLYVVPSVVATGEVGGFMLPIYSVSMLTNDDLQAPASVLSNEADANGDAPEPQQYLRRGRGPNQGQSDFSPTPILNSDPTYYPAPTLSAPASVAISEATLEAQKQMSIRILLAAVWLMPGFFALCGGGVGYLTYRCVTPRVAAVIRDPGVATLDRQVVSGRFSTVVSREEA